MRLTLSEYMALAARQAAKDTSGRSGRYEDTPRTEKSLHEAILDECRRRRWYVIHARMDQKSTIGVGAPDFLILADGGRTLAIECKRVGGKLRPEQAAARHWILGLGHEYHVVHSLQEFLTVARISWT